MKGYDKVWSVQINVDISAKRYILGYYLLFISQVKALVYKMNYHFSVLDFPWVYDIYRNGLFFYKSNLTFKSTYLNHLTIDPHIHRIRFYYFELEGAWNYTSMWTEVMRPAAFELRFDGMSLLTLSSTGDTALKRRQAINIPKQPLAE